MVLARSGVVALVLVLSVPVSGQQLMTVASQPKEEALKINVRTFEEALKMAVTNAGMKLQQWAQLIEPGVVLAFAADPAVRSVPMLDDSLVFHVEVSEILPTSIRLWSQANSMKGRGAQQVGAMGSPGLIAADPMRGSPAPSPNVTPDQQYTSLVRQALVDTMLDSSGVLPLSGEQMLTVACNPVDVLVTNQLQRNPSKQLVLAIKGKDLLAYRNRTLSREDAKQRIIERRF
jgi:hypothetical protein